MGLTMPKRFSTLRVSMVCNAGTSTRSSECSGLKGILVVLVEWRVSAGCRVWRVGRCWCTRTSGMGELVWRSASVTSARGSGDEW